MDKDIKKQKLRRYLNGTYLASETDEVHQCLLDACEKQDSIETIASEIWEEAKDSRDYDTKKASLYYKEAQSILQQLNQKKRAPRIKRLTFTSLSIAASLLLIAGISYLISYHHSQAPVFTEIVTSVGEKKQVLLPDGSKVMLNTCSRLTYPVQFHGDNRSVKLNGQAFFEIAHDEDKPFIVESNDFNVKVLGTVFDIKAYPSDEMATVSVQSGKVEVQLEEATLRLKKEDQVLFNRLSGELKTKKGNKHVASWRKGHFVFNSTPIKDVVHELQRRYHCTIQFQKGQDFNNLISGEHDSESLESILESLHYVSGLNYKKENGIITIYK